MEKDAGLILSKKLQDRSFRAGLNLAGDKPVLDAEASALEWYSMDFEYAQTPVRHLDVEGTGPKLTAALGSDLQEFTIANYVSLISTSA